MEENNLIFDVIVIGGGATGCGVALDASLRGLKTLLLERGDFSSGTSSKSTKLLHGGVRYLEAAIKNLDKNQYNLIKESLKERFLLIKNAPHLCHKIELFTPVYRWFEVPYIFTGLTIYDLLSGRNTLGRSGLVSKSSSLSEFPMLKKSGLKGCVKYYDGQFNDFRMNITIAKTAELHGAILRNYSEVVELIKENGKIKGVIYKDRMTNKTHEALSRVVINATGPFTDIIRQMDNKDSENIMQLSSGIHIVLDSITLSNKKGVLIPKTEDGRVIFILPWEGVSIIGTTDEPSDITHSPTAKAEEVEYLLRHINKYFDLNISKKDIKSVWSGIRPLLKDNGSSSTNSIVRDYRIEISDSNLVTITGGKWTTFRKMAEKVMDTVVKKFSLKATGSVTERVVYYGSEGFNDEFIEQFMAQESFDKDILQHILSTYGTKAYRIINMAKENGLGERILNNKPFIFAEVLYAIKKEYAKTPLDFLCRRVALAQTDLQSAKQVVDKISDIFASWFHWSAEQKNNLIKETVDSLNNMNKWRGE